MSWFTSLFRPAEPNSKTTAAPAPAPAAAAAAPTAAAVADAPRFTRSRETEGWPGLAASLATKGMSQSVAPQLLLCCRTGAMAEALLTLRPAATDGFLDGVPSLMDFPDGAAAARFPLRRGEQLGAFVEELFKGRYGNANVEVVGGVAAAAPVEQARRVIALFGTKEGMRLGNVSMW